MPPPEPEQATLAFVADEAIRRCFELLNAEHPLHKCGSVWSNLDALTRRVWLHAACLDGGLCLEDWSSFENTQRTRLMLALQDMTEFFQQIGERP